MNTVWVMLFVRFGGESELLGAFSSLAKAMAERDYWKSEGAGSEYRWYMSTRHNDPLQLRTDQGDCLLVKPVVVDLPVSSWQFHKKAS